MIGWQDNKKKDLRKMCKLNLVCVFLKKVLVRGNIKLTGGLKKKLCPGKRKNCQGGIFFFFLGAGGGVWKKLGQGIKLVNSNVG